MEIMSVYISVGMHFKTTTKYGFMPIQTDVTWCLLRVNHSFLSAGSHVLCNKCAFCNEMQYLCIVSNSI